MVNYFEQKTQSGCFFMDLSKAFDTLDHSLLLVKLSAYCFDNNSLSFVQKLFNKQISKM